MLERLLDEDEARLLDPDATLVLGDGSQVRATAPDLLWTFPDGETVIGEMFERPARLRDVELDLDEVGRGVLVDRGDGEYADFEVYLPARNPGGRVIVPVARTGEVPFGRGFTEEGQGYHSWTGREGSSLYTRVAVGDPGQGRYRVYEWHVSAAADDSTGVVYELVPDDLGIVCLDFVENTATRC